MNVRPAAVAGTWHPATTAALSREVDDYVGAATPGPVGTVTAIVVPHAGIMFSGPVAAHAFKAAAEGSYDVAVLVGPSHFAAFDGVALDPDGAFAWPFGAIAVDSATASAIESASYGLVRPLASAHKREHSLEMQLPFLGRLLPGLPIVPLLIGHQIGSTIERLSSALASALAGQRALLGASTDLSHDFDAKTAAPRHGAGCDAVAAFDPEQLLSLFEGYPDSERGRSVGCGMGAAISVMMAARALGAREARARRYGRSGEVSGDDACVVGYLAAVMGTFDAE